MDPFTICPFVFLAVYLSSRLSLYPSVSLCFRPHQDTDSSGISVDGDIGHYHTRRLLVLIDNRRYHDILDQRVPHSMLKMLAMYSVAGSWYFIYLFNYFFTFFHMDNSSALL